MKEEKCGREVSTGSWENKQENRKEKKNIGNTKEEWGRRPQISCVLSFHCPITYTTTTTTTTTNLLKNTH